MVRFVSIVLSDGLAMPPGISQLWEEKIDGVFEELPLPRFEPSNYGTPSPALSRQNSGIVILGERMRSGEFYGFDARGPGLERAPLRERLKVLDAMPGLLRPATGQGGAFLRAVLARGGEGVVVKDLESYPGSTWTKIKRSQVFYGFVRELNTSKGSARVDLVHPSAFEPSNFGPSFEPSNFLTGDNGGWIAMRSRFEAVKIGDVLKLEAYGQHAS